LEQYKGNVILIVNVASKCGYTSQYDGLEALYKKYKDQGLVVLGFPCNQFGSQEPGSEAEIQNFCRVNFGVTFPMFSKINVNGDDTHPLYRYLKSEQPGILGTEIIKWNFTKFLVSKEGKVIERFGSSIKPISLEKEIEVLLK
ncbi:MAG: glutathione peroxidase, partial [Sulfurovum sp.]|nr:glutathione peroxidase [Sulfurovum sp.]NNJ45547.1 glutathione peroxidase [Sulfurovum sp.]